MKAIIGLTIVGLFMSLLIVLPVSAQADWCDGFCVKDPVEQLQNIRHRPEALGFRIGSWDYDLGQWSEYDWGYHVQGIARYNTADGTPYLFITTNRDEGAELVIARMDSRDNTGERMRSNRLLWNTDTDITPAPASDVVETVFTFSGWNHAGGIAVIQHYLVVPIEDGMSWNINPNGERKIGSFAIFDIQDPPNPVLINEHPAWDASIEETKIGVAGITREPDGRYLVLLGVTRGKTSNKEVKFLRSSTTALETSTFELVNEQHPGEQFRTQSNSDLLWDTTYQNFNFIRDCDDGSLYLLATFSTSSAPLGGDDKAHLFQVSHDSATDTYAIDDDARLLEGDFSCKTYDSEKHCDFTAAVGSYISPSGELILYAAPHYKNTDDGVDEIPVGEFRYRDVAIASSPLWKPKAILTNSVYEINEGETVTFDGTASRPTAIQGWIDFYEDERYTDSMITLDWADRMLQNWEVLHEIDGFDDEADSIRYYTPCPSTITLCNGNHFDEKCINTACGLGAIPILDDLDMGDNIESVKFNGEGVNTLTKTEWNFGDGYIESVLTESHQFSDNGEFTVALRVTEQDGDSDVTVATVTVNNVVPTVYAGADTTISEGAKVSISGRFTDPGEADGWTATVDYGDGTPVQTLTLNMDKTFTLSHAYGDNKNNEAAYTVTVSISDKDGGTGSDTVDVTVRNVKPIVSIDTVGQPNAHFILPEVHTLTFNGSFIDAGWLDTHTSRWDFGDSTTLEGILKEENVMPDATGTSDQSYIYTHPGSYTILLTVQDDDGGVRTDQKTLEVISSQQAMEILDSYIQALPNDAFKANPTQRKNALHEKYLKIVGWIEMEDYQGAKQSVLNDVRAKADGTLGGKTADDWITDSHAQSDICRMIDSISAYLDILRTRS